MIIKYDIPETLRRELIAQASRRWDLRSYPARVGDAISQLANALIGGAPDESLSGRSYRIVELQADRPPIFWQVVRWCAEALFWIKDRGDHCQLAFWEDVMRARARAVAADLAAEAIGLQTFGSGDSLRREPVTQTDEE